VSIEFECEECDRVLRVNEKHAGRRIKCPGCGASIRIPDDEEEDDFEDEYGGGGGDLDDLFETTPRRPPKKSKPGRKPTRRPAAREPRERRASSSGGDGELTVVDWLLVVFCGGIACIVGIVACLQGDSERGLKMILYPIAIGVVINIVSFVIQSAMQ
jgi:hypothetical protein